MSRFGSSSKFKNALVKVYKKENWIHDLNVGSNLSAGGDQIKASCSCVAFIHESNSIGSVAVLPLNASGRFSQFPLVAGHSRQVTDFTFSPFHDYKLITGSEDGLVKLWDIPEEGLCNGGNRISTSSLTVGPLDGKIEAVLCHPSADNVLAVSCQQSALIYDLNTLKKCADLSEHPSNVESLSWGNHGQLLASMCKDANKKLLQVYDPRSSTSASSRVNYYSGQKSSKVLFLEGTDCLVTAGLGMTREVEIALWDMKKFGKPVVKHSLGSSSGNPTLLYDEDSKLLFAGVKSESTVTYYDASTSLVPCQQVYRGALQTKGLTIVPKRALNVMACEVVRLLQLTQNAVIPISYHVQRKSYSEFHEELFPHTRGGVASMTAEEWLQGANNPVELVTLNPSELRAKDRKKEGIVKRVQSTDIKETSQSNVKKEIKPEKKTDKIVSGSSAKKEIAVPSAETSSCDKSGATKSKNIVRSSKFRHIEGSSKDRATFITKFPSLSSTVPGDSNSFQANRKRAAVVFSISGGQIGVFELAKTGRMDRGQVPTLQNGSSVMDFAFNPFDSNQLLVACEDAKLKLWTIPPNGLEQTLTEPQYLLGHDEKPNVIQFHPQASGIFSSAGYDCQLLLWNLFTGLVHVIDTLTAPLFCMCWNQDGSRLATFSKDQVLALYDPRSPGPPVCQGKLDIGGRGARLVWLEDKVIALSGFNRSSVRTVFLFNTSNLNSPISEILTNTSPATLFPFYDRDTKILYLTGKGDGVIQAYEYDSNDSPYLFAVSPFQCGNAHQSVVFLPKTACDVSKVEIATGLRLTTSSVEGFAIRVPRTRTSYFQDDIYPDTLCVEESSITAEKWLLGNNAAQRTQTLKPTSMKNLSEAPKEPAAAKKFVSYNPKYKTDQEKKDELMSAMIGRMGDKEDDPLPQRDMDGVDSDEWSD